VVAAPMTTSQNRSMFTPSDLIVMFVTLVITSAAGLGWFAARVRLFEARLNKQFEQVRRELGEVRQEIGKMRKNIVELKVAVARLEGQRIFRQPPHRP